MDQKEYRKTLIAEANKLGLEFHSNIKSAKLQGMVDAKQGGSVGVSANDITPEVEKVVPDERKMTPHEIKRRKIIASKRRAMETKIVTITNRDTRDAEHATTAHLAFENNHFSCAKNVPLDMAVELEVALIKIAIAAEIPVHKAEMKDGKATGNKVTVMVPKYTVSFEENTL